MNTRLLRRVVQHILEEPKRLYMSWYLIEKSEKYPDVAGRKFAKCGTAACIAGWTCILSGIKGDPIEIRYHREGMRLLGIDNDAAECLFEPGMWPKKFKAGLAEDGKLKTARVAAARIEHFIKTKGAE